MNGYISVLFFAFWAADILLREGPMIDLQAAFEDRGLPPLLDKVRGRRAADYDDGLALYRSTDLLALGYMANLVRERLHGNVTYFNVNRHINPTDVCVASCKLCAFGKRARRSHRLHHVAGGGLA